MPRVSTSRRYVNVRLWGGILCAIAALAANSCQLPDAKPNKSERALERMRHSEDILITLAYLGMDTNTFTQLVAARGPLWEARHATSPHADLQESECYEVIRSDVVVSRFHFRDNALVHVESFVTDKPVLGGVFIFADALVSICKPIGRQLAGLNRRSVVDMFLAGMIGEGYDAHEVTNDLYPHELRAAGELWAWGPLLKSGRVIPLKRRNQVTGDAKCRLYGVYSESGDRVDRYVLSPPNLGAFRTSALPGSGSRQYMLTSDDVDFEMLQSARERFERLRVTETVFSAAPQEQWRE